MAAREPKKKATKISASFDGDHFPENLFVNCYCCTETAGGILIYFGFRHDGVGADDFAVFLEGNTLTQSAESMLTFVGTIEVEDDKDARFDNLRPSASIAKIHTANFIGMAQSQGVGEIRLGNFSLGSAIDRAKRSAASSVAVSGYGIALLRCPLLMMKQLILSIYATEV